MRGEKNGAMAVAAGPRRPRTFLHGGRRASGNTLGTRSLCWVLDGLPLILVLAGVAQVAAIRLGKCIDLDGPHRSSPFVNLHLPRGWNKNRAIRC